MLDYGSIEYCADCAIAIVVNPRMCVEGKQQSLTYYVGHHAADTFPGETPAAKMLEKLHTQALKAETK